MPQFKVPQNLDMEDRIIGHLTLTQFGYLAFGGMVAYVFLIKLPSPLGLIVALPIAVISFALAVIRVQDQPFPKFLLSLIKYVGTPRERRWHHGGEKSDSLIKADKALAIKKTAPTKKQYDPSEIKKIAETVDSHGFSSVDNDE